MYEVQSGDSLYRVTLYELYTVEGSVTIKLQEALTESVYKFTAVPCNHMVEAEEQYVGRGSSEEEALNLCLRKIRNVPVSQLFHIINAGG